MARRPHASYCEHVKSNNVHEFCVLSVQNDVFNKHYFPLKNSIEKWESAVAHHVKPDGKHEDVRDDRKCDNAELPLHALGAAFALEKVDCFNYKYAKVIAVRVEKTGYQVSKNLVPSNFTLYKLGQSVYNPNRSR